MSEIEIKSQIHLLVDKVEDIAKLENILSFISQDTDIFDELNVSQQKAILNSLESISEEKFTTNEAMKFEVKKWLTR